MARKKANTAHKVDTTSASRAGHTFHERWAARRALQLVFPQDGLKAIGVEGLSTSETAKPGSAAEEVADLVLYYGDGENFATSRIVETVQFKYKTTAGDVTASYLRKTIEKFARSFIGYQKSFSAPDVDKKLKFSFVTNADFSPALWGAIKGLQTGAIPIDAEALKSYKYLKKICEKEEIDSQRLFSRCEFRAAQETLSTQNNLLRRTITDWSAGVEGRAKSRILELFELVREKAGPRGQHNNLIKREDILVALNCEPEDLFPANTRFVNISDSISREQLQNAIKLIVESSIPVFIHAEGGVGKTVFVNSLAAIMLHTHEVVVFDCFGGGAYRFPDQARHLPSVGFIQIANELASRGLCDPLLSGEAESVELIKALRRRLTQAVATLKMQSKKEGILIFIDAADNAQIEADNRKDSAFPKLLLASLSTEKIDGVQLILTARTHRMSTVVEQSKIAPLPLLPFSEEEAKAFINGRLKKAPAIEFATAFSRSRGNARVLAYLIETWATNVVSSAVETEITVEQLIAEKCEKIFVDLHVVGWLDKDIREFFAAISLLPPPIPLEELANALGWQTTQVKSAVSDLAPMLEIVPHGAIFRDEPTETYVYDTYSNEKAAQQTIAQRLQEAQITSTYAAEALPNFLVAINDSDRAYELAKSMEFPSIIQSDFGRRRLMLARLNAAFRLAVKSGDLDRTLSIIMRLAQVSAANSRGDEFIRRSPALAVTLGDPDAYRRLFNDRSGWRGARDARLTIAHAFSNEMEEAKIHCNRLIDWINWNARQPHDEYRIGIASSQPDENDFAAALFLNIINNDYKVLDKNLTQWNVSFAISVCRQAIKLTRQYECVSGTNAVDALAAFAATSKCKSFALKVSLLNSAYALTSLQRKLLARSLKAMRLKAETSKISSESMDGNIIYAAFAALINDGPDSAARILRSATKIRPSSYDYSERHGLTKAWLPVLHACIAAWSKKRIVAIHDLLPQGVKITRTAKGIKNQSELREFLSTQPALRKKHQYKRKKGIEKQFSDRECQDIARGIDVVLQVVEPLQTSLLISQNDTVLTNFLANWDHYFPKGLTRQFEEPHQLLGRTVGLGFTRLLMQHAPNITEADATRLIDIVSDKRFILRDRLSVLMLFAVRPDLQNRSGMFAHSLAENVREDDYVEQRGEGYASIAEALLNMNIAEARVYYRSGLSELDKLGSNDYDLIYAILHYAAVQPGGPIRPDLAHRLMNLTQTICTNEPSKFDWTLFAKASAKSIGTTAATKIMRWDDQDVAEFSYGLPQLACFLATEKQFTPRRAAALLTICEDHGWHEWSIGDGLNDLMALTNSTEEQRIIFSTVFCKLKLEHSNGGWPSVWKSLLHIADKISGVASQPDVAELRKLQANAERKRDDLNACSVSQEQTVSTTKPSVEVDPEDLLLTLITKCDPASAASIDEALNSIESDPSLPYFTKNHLFEKLRTGCLYEKRLGHLFALAGSLKIPIDDAIDYISYCINSWSESSAHIVANVKTVLEHLFQSKGSELFNLRYGNISHELHKLNELSGDGTFVLRLVLNTIATERLEPDAKEWLQLATALCQQTSVTVARQALEDFLSGPATGLADGIGEGVYKDAFHIDDECELISGIVWHLLGDDDAYVRWSTARALSTFVELDLIQELGTLLDHFDRIDVPALRSPNHNLSFQNSQQWLLMGLARAALIHKDKLAALKPRLFLLSTRSDLHILHKRHILRCLSNIGGPDNEIASLKEVISIDPKGVTSFKGWPKHVEAKSGFSFGYDFMRYKVSSLAQLFFMSEGEITDAIAEEIKQRWPQAQNMAFFPGHDRYCHDSSDRYEFYREHLQKHAVLAAATTLRNSHPVARESYDDNQISPFERWLKDYDITFDDGSWLADHKDEIPQIAKAHFMGPHNGKTESIIEAEAVFERLGLADIASGNMIPIFGQWRSPDGVYVRIVSALGEPKGIIGRCDAFSKRASHDLWLPMFENDGLEAPYRQERPFDSFICMNEKHGLGVDAGEKIATGGAALRPRLGVDLTTQLGLISDVDSRVWKTASNEPALRSQVWGEWLPSSDNYRHHYNEEGEILMADLDWLDQALPKIGKQIVYKITLEKYKDRHLHDSFGAKAVYVATKASERNLRFWLAKKASATKY